MQVFRIIKLRFNSNPHARDATFENFLFLTLRRCSHTRHFCGRMTLPMNNKLQLSFQFNLKISSKDLAKFSQIAWPNYRT